ncbi:MAG: hypothetical protein Q9227_007121 [Pyrenula ochraceoflavens]
MDSWRASITDEKHTDTERQVKTTATEKSGPVQPCDDAGPIEFEEKKELSGGIIRLAEYFFDPALSFAQGWNTVYANIVGIPAEITAAGVIVQFWNKDINVAVWITIFSILVVASNIFLVRVYGELEFGFAILKILLISIVIVAGGGPDHHAYGFEYWKQPGPFVQYLGIDGSLGQFLGFWTTFANAVYAYASIETISVAAAETRAPRRNIPKAAKRIFWRVLLFYGIIHASFEGLSSPASVVSILMVSMIVPSNDSKLLNNSGTAAQSPFVIAVTRTAIPVVPHIINTVVLTSAWSSANSGMLNGSRTLYGLARERHAPHLFLLVNRFGIPYLSVAFLSCFLVLAYMSVQHTAAQVFGWLQNLVAVATLVNWMTICLVYLRMYYGMQRQGISRNELPWKGPCQPWAAWVSLVSFAVILLTGGYSVFIRGHWSGETFVTSYFNIPLILGLYLGYKVVKRTTIVPLEEIPVRKYVEIARANPEPVERKNRGWRKLNLLWS